MSGTLQASRVLFSRSLRTYVLQAKVGPVSTNAKYDMIRTSADNCSSAPCEIVLHCEQIHAVQATQS